MTTESRLVPLPGAPAPAIRVQVQPPAPGGLEHGSEVACRERPCPHCGGSGMLRLDDQRFRTCLDCLGQGRITLASCPDAGALSDPTSSAA